jgi:hypothetical protein
MHLPMPIPNMPLLDLEAYLVADATTCLNYNHYPCELNRRFRYHTYERIQDKPGQFMIELIDETTHDVIAVRWSTFVRNFAPIEYAALAPEFLVTEWIKNNQDIESTVEQFASTQFAQLQTQLRTQGGGSAMPYPAPMMMSPQQLMQPPMQLMQQPMQMPRYGS